MKPKEKKQTNKYGTKRALKIVGIVMLVYLLLHIRPLKDPYGDTFIAFNMDSLFGFFSSSGEGVVLFPHTMETELGSITMNPFCWVRYTDGYQRGIDNEHFTSQLYFNNQELKNIERIFFSRIHDIENLDMRKSESRIIDGIIDICLLFPYSGHSIFIGTTEIKLSQFCNTNFNGSADFNNYLLTIIHRDGSNYDGKIKFSNQITVNYNEFAHLFIPSTIDLWQLSDTDGNFLIEGLTNEPLECTKIYFEPDWGAIKKVVTPEGEELEF